MKKSKTTYLGKNKYRLEVYANDPTLTAQPSAKDTWLEESNPDDNHGLETSFNILDYIGYTYRAILEFDISSLPVGAELISATLELYFYTSSGAVTGKTVWAYKLNLTDWVEAQATWNIYKTGSNWTAAGGDYVTSNPSGGSVAIPAGYGWMSWNVLDIVQDAYDNVNPAEFLIKYETEGRSSNFGEALFHSNNYTFNTSRCPKLVIDYIPTGVTHELAGVIAGVASVSGAVLMTRGLAGLASGICSATASLTVRGIKWCAGVVAGVASVSGATSILKTLVGVASGKALVTADLTNLKWLAGVITGKATTAARISILLVLAGVAAGKATVTASLGLLKLLAGLSQGVAAVRGSLTRIIMLEKLLKKLIQLEDIGGGRES